MSEPNKSEGAKTPRKLGARLRELRQARHLSGTHISSTRRLLTLIHLQY
jgi:hypothetical protein